MNKRPEAKMIAFLTVGPLARTDQFILPALQSRNRDLWLPCGIFKQKLYPFWGKNPLKRLRIEQDNIKMNLRTVGFARY